MHEIMADFNQAVNQWYGSGPQHAQPSIEFHPAPLRDYAAAGSQRIR